MSENSDDSDGVIERPRGILTKDDRQLLRGEKDVDDQTRRDTRYRIRNRVKNSLEDFAILARQLPKEDRESIFDSLSENDYMAVEHAIMFFYLGIDGTEADFEDVLANGIEWAETLKDLERIINVSIDIEINTEEPDIDVVVERLTSGEGTLDDYNYAAAKGSLVPVLEHFIEHKQDLELKMPDDEAEGIVVDLDSMEKLYESFSDDPDEE